MSLASSGGQGESEYNQALGPRCVLLGPALEPDTASAA